MKENIIDLVDVSVVDGQIVVTPKNGVYVQLVDKAIDDDWVDSWEDLPSEIVEKRPILGVAFNAIKELGDLMAQPCVNGDWKPDWNDADQEKWCIEFFGNRLQVYSYENTAFFLAFKYGETAEKFLQKYRSYIEKAAPILFGVEL